MKKFKYIVKVWNNVDSKLVTFTSESKQRNDDEERSFGISKLMGELKYDFETPPEQHTTSGKVRGCEEVD